ncbi:hypothetical protein, variant [Cryptococcus neoformans var. grubii H99]|uniref:Stealth protein CR3 conserved region 3 domain-containing protein n=1 Tax=Cryptococcus neoformans (strain H99 / ATCC 208821 / CBS 10515 / FGSC 9487) TaxID=235443 RepID=T2BPK5_CRYN9|nr:hypothetical protein, variant [Cryptococcus neoformans var. grubii H99]AGV14656.1 hypothetical protein, variant [Cryptococcus neoformans var. grubii H99]AUB27543.1 hypothetical protein CKF44_04705 [Cryptococcus neoformans var. grubii]|eukprot:XP_012052156.1 hypothetical protein, variant [Cryptococcus neoformans var. grubii H99]
MSQSSNSRDITGETSSSTPEIFSPAHLISHLEDKERSHDPESLRERKQDGEDYELDEFDSSSEEESHNLLPYSLLPFGKRKKLGHWALSERPIRRLRPMILSFGAFTIVGILVTAYLFMGVSIPSESFSPATNAANLNLSNPLGNGSADSQSWKFMAKSLKSDPTHIVVPAHEAPSVALLEPLHDRLPYSMLSQYFTSGRLPPSITPSNVPPQRPLDLVYLFVNASSPYWFREMEARAALEDVKVGKGSGRSRHWRDNGELRAAVRSGVKALGDEAGRVHIVTADWPVREEDTELQVEAGKWRIGQIAEWLDWDSQKREGRLKWHFHSEIFQLPKDGGVVDLRRSVPRNERAENEKGVQTGSKWQSEEAWRNESLPSFNSFGIEQRLTWLEGLSENYISFNDDMFLLRPLSTSDFRHPLAGNLVRFDPGLLVPDVMTPDQLSDPGEWGALQHANQLLSARFSAHKRFYMHHLPKTQSRTILHEASIMWSPQLGLASTRGFRESKRGEGDVEMAWLITHLRVERWREALLWSWIVAKLGEKDVWEDDEKRELKKILGMTSSQGEEIEKAEITKGSRSTLGDLDALTEAVGWEGPKATDYHFSSMDGHLSSSPDDPGSGAQCTFHFSTCLPPHFFDSSTSFSASTMFTRLAFERPQCGDCLITALIKASGKRGLSAFLPEEDQIFYPEQEEEKGMWRRNEPILPLVSSWKDGDFSLRANVKAGQDVWDGFEAREDGGVSLRAWCIKLLSRYNYVYGSTPSRFTPVHSLYQLSSTLESVDNTPEVAMLCVNDDQADSGSDKSRQKFGAWMERRWGGVIEGVDWERPNVSWVD